MRAAHEVERDRGLVGEQPSNARSPCPIGPAEARIEHLEHADGHVVECDGDREERVRDIADRLRLRPREARIGREVVDGERLPGRERPPGDPLGRGEPGADEVALPRARHRGEDELRAALVEQENRRRLRPEERPRHVGDRLQQSAMVFVGAEDRCRGCGPVQLVVTAAILLQSEELGTGSAQLFRVTERRHLEASAWPVGGLRAATVVEPLDLLREMLLADPGV